MTNLSSLKPAYITDNATAVAADIAIGKTAYVNGGVVTGTATVISVSGGVNGIQLLIENPVGTTSATYQPTEDGVLIKNTDLTLTSSEFDLDTNGLTSSSLSTRQFAYITGLPVNAGIRKWEVWGETIDGTPTQYAGFNIRYNYVDASNFYETGLTWDGTYWRLITTYNLAGSPTYTNITNFSSIIDWPCKFHLIAYDMGDNVIVQCTIWEIDAPADDGGSSFSFVVSTRPFKSATEGMFVTAGVGLTVKVKGCKVSDL